MPSPQLTFHPVSRAPRDDGSPLILAQARGNEGKTASGKSLREHFGVAIHPFVDGNGCTARLVMNLALFRHGYPPTIILRANRRQYYQALMQADGGQPEALVNFVGKAVERSLVLYLEACTPQTAPPAPEDDWISLSEAAEGTPYSQEYLSLLARKGRLEAIKRGRVWYTTRRLWRPTGNRWSNDLLQRNKEAKGQRKSWDADFQDLQDFICIYPVNPVNLRPNLLCL